MADNSKEIDVINHLLEVEKAAAALVEQGSVEADKRLSEARIKANQEFQKRVQTETEILEKNYEQELSKLNDNHQQQVSSFKSDLLNLNQNTSDFNKLLDQLLFNSQKV
ncbi:MAG: hypothetical protein MJ160_03095 [Treponema sp.]|nr:hypothetical protein [Treponema sp.]